MIRAKDVVVLASLINIAVVALILTTSVQHRSEFSQMQIASSGQFIDSKLIDSKSVDSKSNESISKGHKTSSSSVGNSSSRYLGRDQKPSKSDPEISLEEAPSVLEKDNLCLDEIDALLEEYEKAEIGAYQQKKTSSASQGNENAKKGEEVTVKKNSQIELKQKSTSIASKKNEKPISSEQVQYIAYTIQKGDNPWKIAKRFGMSFEELLKINSLDAKSAKNLKIGQVLKVISPNSTSSNQQKPLTKNSSGSTQIKKAPTTQ